MESWPSVSLGDQFCSFGSGIILFSSCPRLKGPVNFSKNDIVLREENKILKLLSPACRQAGPFAFGEWLAPAYNFKISFSSLYNILYFIHNSFVNSRLLICFIVFQPVKKINHQNGAG